MKSVQSVSGRRDQLDLMNKQYFIDNIGQLYNEQIDCDVTLEVDGEEFKAHKIILKARSKVFNAMFSHRTEENLNNRAVIGDIDKDVFRQILEFLYTGDKTKLDLDMSIDLLIGADKVYH